MATDEIGHLLATILCIVRVKATVPAKPKRKLSTAGRANIIAATKARWARVNAAKAKAK